MASGPDHYQEAERLLDLTFDRYDTIEERTQVVARAQAHATLALAAVTLDVAVIAAGHSSPMGAAWQEVTS